MYRYLALQLFLQITSLLLASGFYDGSIEATTPQKDLKEMEGYSNVATSLQSDNLEISSDEDIAQEQVDSLSLVTRYAGTGYNLIRGNPEGDFDSGGVDPGIKTTNEIFAHTYSKRKKAFYLGEAMDVPDQVNFHMSESCASSESMQAYSGRKSYMKELEGSVSLEGSYIIIINRIISVGMSFIY